MKTAGKITATLALLIGLYVLSYWLLIKKEWIDRWFLNSSSSIQVYWAVKDVFAPIRELDHIWTVDLPIQKHLTGHWRSETNSDFVTLGPNQECHFQLGQFTFTGTARYERYEGGFSMEFPHQEQTCFFVLGLPSSFETLKHSEQATAQIGPTFVDPFQREIEYEATLTKQTPSAPAP